MSDVVSPLLQWLNAHPQWAGLVIFAISAGESAPIFGTLVPGSITMTAFGALAGAGVIPLWSTFFWAILGAIVGDGIGYWIGHYFKDKLHYVWPFKSNPEILRQGEVFFGKYGGMSVFIGRFVGPVRALVPLVAGMLGMKPWHFTIANVASAILWAPAYLLPGILLGAVSLELPPGIALHFIMVLFFILLFIILCVWFFYKLYQLIKTQIFQFEQWLWGKLRANKFFYPLTRLLSHWDSSKKHGQLNLVLFFLLTSFLLLLLCIYVRCVGSAHIMINDVILHFFRGLRTNEFVENLMLGITLLGQKQILFVVFIVLFGWFLLCKRFRAALHIFALALLASCSIFVIKHLVKSPRPWGVLHNENSYSLPSGHTTLATIFFIGFVFFISRTLRPISRWIIYFFTISIVCLVGISRLYLNAHWFTDVLAGWLLGTAILTITIISYQRRVDPPIPHLPVFFITLLTFILTFGFYYQQNVTPLKINFAQTEWPIVQTSMNNWWEEKTHLPVTRTTVFGFSSQRINLEWKGSLEQIRDTLLAEGWTKPPSRDLVSTIHRIADISSYQYLPLISPQYLDKKPVLTLTRQANPKTMLVMRLWESNLKVSTDTTIWAGTVDIVPRSYSWIFKKRSHIDISSDAIFPLKKQAKSWEWKLIIDDHQNNHPQKILLVRKK